MPGRLLVDTDVLVEYLRGRIEAGEWLESQEADLLVSAITVAALFAGVKSERESQVPSPLSASLGLGEPEPE